MIHLLIGAVIGGAVVVGIIVVMIWTTPTYL